jgi:CRP/FNR family transcriptional regulator
MSRRALAAGADEFDLPMTRTDIADYLGLTMETVSRGISSLKRKGLIALKGPQHVIILDRDGLEELSEGDAE